MCRCEFYRRIVIVQNWTLSLSDTEREVKKIKCAVKMFKNGKKIKNQVGIRKLNLIKSQ